MEIFETIFEKINPLFRNVSVGERTNYTSKVKHLKFLYDKILQAAYILVEKKLIKEK